MNGLVCGVCGYVSIDGAAPDNCPVCRAPKTSFQEKDAIKTPKDEGPKEKHVPVIKVVHQCGLIGDGCIEIHVKIGEVPHPMEAAHYIVWVDFYINKKWVERVHLSPDCSPAAAAHLKSTEGKLTAIEFCNLHGHWISEVDL